MIILKRLYNTIYIFISLFHMSNTINIEVYCIFVINIKN